MDRFYLFSAINERGNDGPKAPNEWLVVDSIADFDKVLGCAAAKADNYCWTEVGGRV